MRNVGTLILACLTATAVPLSAQVKPIESSGRQVELGNAPASSTWSRVLTERAKRGTLHDAFQHVRGDTGKWNDAPILQPAPPITQKPAKMTLDDWADQLLAKKDFQNRSSDDNWLLFRTRQLDDNDRVWADRIERQGNQFMVVVSEAIWQGRYSKTFTYYSVVGVNLGKLTPGTYEVKWVIKPLAFKQFEGDGRPTENWPKDERPTDQEPTELRTSFRVAAELSSNDRP